MSLKVNIFFIFLTFAGIYSQAAAFEPNYQRDCAAHFIPDDHFQVYMSDETKEITDKTGIRFMELTEATLYKPEKTTFQPASAAEKTIFAKRISEFIKIFPVSLLKQNSDTCFVFVKSFKAAAAITIGSVIVIATDSKIWNRTIAHEFLHAIDSLHGAESNLKNWNDINKDAGCEYSDSSRVLKPGFPDVNSCWVSPYGGSDIMEDRAEIFSAMVEDYSLLMNILAKKAPGSSALSKKIDVLQNYLKIFSPEMDHSYWQGPLEQHSSWNQLG